MPAVSFFSQVLRSIQRNDVNALDALLRKGPPLGTLLQALQRREDIVKHGATPMGQAVKADSEACVRRLLEVDPRLAMDRDEGLNIPLMFAVHRSTTAMLDLLLPVSDAHAQDKFGNTALHEAVTHDNLLGVQRLWPLFEPKPLNREGQTLLMVAANFGKLRSLHWLLPLSDPQMLDHKGWTALMLAAANGHADVVEALLPVSDPRVLGLRHGKQVSAFQLALSHSQSFDNGPTWACVDLLALHEPVVRPVAAVFSKGGSERMPRWASRREADELHAAMGSSIENLQARSRARL